VPYHVVVTILCDKSLSVTCGQQVGGLLPVDMSHPPVKLVTNIFESSITQPNIHISNPLCYLHGKCRKKDLQW
jgi:hypothetical protein